MELLGCFRALRWLLQARQRESAFFSSLKTVKIQTQMILICIFYDRFFLFIARLIARDHAHRIKLLSHELGELGLELSVLGCELVSGESVEAQFVGLQSLLYSGQLDAQVFIRIRLP
jgi:hypothetical protein